MFNQKMMVAILISLLIGTGIGFGVAQLLLPKESLVQPLKIGVLLPFTKGSVTFARMGYEAFSMAAEEINAAGGILGRPVVLVRGDTEGNSEVAISVAKKLITVDGVSFLCGTFLSGECMAVAEVAKNYKTIYINTNPFTNEFTQLVINNYTQYKYLFRTGINTTQMAYEWVSLGTQLYPTTKTILLFAEDLKWARDCYAELVRLWPQYEFLQLLSAVGTVEFTAEIELIKNMNPDLILSDLIVSSSMPFIKQWLGAKLGIPLLDAGLGADPTIQKEIGYETMNYYIFFTQCGNVTITPKTRSYYNAFLQRTGTRPFGFVDIRSYDTMYILKDAIERAGTFDTDKVIEALEKTDYVGAQGRYRFIEGHQADYMHGVVTQLVDEKTYVVAPAQVAEKPLETPP
jgi:branched-chain amino acid transport system substrate-binding protein